MKESIKKLVKKSLIIRVNFKPLQMDMVRQVFIIHTSKTLAKIKSGKF